ncbi:D-ribose pyranase [Vibrio sp. MEBiC08052]|uniref:D-ribose pyranase n=1 Tax=Vibrio sp. MEBiC08052 TaxID=1761910 RepID=UPI000740729E|nr:D-ribose pyranase [Vibrio sp. MEBiC08052]KUI97224.1 putative ribose ABC transporter protein [Vibrio sp. MEBiC08052]
MKKNQLLNSELSYLVATLGHTDEVTVCDAGLPIPETTSRIDLALTYGVPGFIETVRTLLAEMQIEGVVLAAEFREVSPHLHTELQDLLAIEEQKTGKTIRRTYISHEAFKSRSGESRAVVRTGECTPYANVIFQAGVVF